MDYYKFGPMVISNYLVFYNRQYCYAIIPVVKLLPGHILLIPKRQVMNFTDLEPNEIFDLSLATRFLTKNIERYFDCTSCTVNIQNFSSDSDSINHCFIHILPRKERDIEKNDLLYPLLQAYPQDFLRHFRNVLGQDNVFSLQMKEQLSVETKKYSDYMEQHIETKLL